MLHCRGKKIIKVKNNLIWQRYTGYYENHGDGNDITGFMSEYVEQKL